MLDGNLAALNRHETDEQIADEVHAKQVADQTARGINPITEYSRDILRNRERLADLFAEIKESPIASDLAFIAMDDSSQAGFLLQSLLIAMAERDAEILGDVYEHWIDDDMDFQTSLMRIESYKRGIK